MDDANYAISVFVILGTAIGVNEITRVRSSPYDALFLFNISFLVYFVFAPLHVLVGGATFTRYSFVANEFGTGSFEDAIWILASYVIVLVSFSLTPNFNTHLRIDRIESRDWWLVLWLSLMVAMLCSAIYSISVGGFFTAFRQAIYIRMGAFEVSGSWLFVKHLIPLFGAVAVLGILLVSDRVEAKKNKAVIGLFVFFLVLLTIYGAILVGGRRALIFPVLSGFLIFSNYRRKWHSKGLVAAVIMAMLVLVFWNAVSFGIRDADFSRYLDGRYGSSMDTYAALWRALADPYMGWVGLHNRDPAWLGFSDIVTAPLQLLPGTVAGDLVPKSVVVFTTETLKGVSVDSTAETPPGFQGYFLINGGYLGLIVGTVIYGIIGKILHNLLLPRRSDPIAWMVYMWVIIGWAYFIRHGVFEFVIVERFHWWFVLILAVFVSSLGIVFQKIRQSRATVAGVAS